MDNLDQNVKYYMSQNPNDEMVDKLLEQPDEQLYAMMLRNKSSMFQCFNVFFASSFQTWPIA